MYNSNLHFQHATKGICERFIFLIKIFINELAQKLNEMIKQRFDKEQNYRSFFQNAPLALFEEDFSKAALCLQEINENIDVDFETYLRAHPQEVEDCLEKISPIQINTESRKLFGNISSNITSLTDPRIVLLIRAYIVLLLVVPSA